MPPVAVMPQLWPGTPTAQQAVVTLQPSARPNLPRPRRSSRRHHLVWIARALHRSPISGWSNARSAADPRARITARADRFGEASRDAFREGALVVGEVDRAQLAQHVAISRSVSGRFGSMLCMPYTSRIFQVVSRSSCAAPCAISRTRAVIAST